MRNADLPAIPLSGDAYEDIGGSSYATGRYEAGMGLTKREYFAAMAMQGLTSSPIEAEKLSHAANKSLKVFVVEQAVAFADALLKELDKGVT